VSQGIAPVRPFHRRTGKAALAGLALAVLALAGCADPTKIAAPAAAVAAGAATDSAAVHGAVCSKIETAWAKFLPNSAFSVIEKESTSGRKYDVLKVNYYAYRQASAGLYKSLTGNREYQLTYDLDVLAAAVSDVSSDGGQIAQATLDLATLKKAAPVVAKDCGTTLPSPTSVTVAATPAATAAPA
jgi:hypothetical protein